MPTHSGRIDRTAQAQNAADNDNVIYVSFGAAKTGRLHSSVLKWLPQIRQRPSQSFLEDWSKLRHGAEVDASIAADMICFGLKPADLCRSVAALVNAALKNGIATTQLNRLTELASEPVWRSIYPGEPIHPDEHMRPQAIRTLLFIAHYNGRLSGSSRALLHQHISASIQGLQGSA